VIVASGTVMTIDYYQYVSYVRERRGAQLQECEESIEQFQTQIHDLGIIIERARESIAKIDKEINESGASVANLRENVRVRRLTRDIAATRTEIESHDMDEVARARQDFDGKYKLEKQKETELQSKV
jgi:DNA repair protein RAD50